MTKNDEENRRKLPTGCSEKIRSWMLTFAETYQRNHPLSDRQFELYEMALDDLNERQLEIGFKRAAKTWNSTQMPPPAFIRKCAEVASETEKFYKPTKHRFDEEWEPIRRFETVEAAWDDWIETEKVMRECREKLNEVVKLKTMPRANDSKMVVATRERMQLLEKQKKQLEETYGQGTAIRVRDSVPRETDQGRTGQQSGTADRTGAGPNPGDSQVKR